MCVSVCVRVCVRVGVSGLKLITTPKANSELFIAQTIRSSGISRYPGVYIKHLQTVPTTTNQPNTMCKLQNPACSRGCSGLLGLKQTDFKCCQSTSCSTTSETYAQIWSQSAQTVLPPWCPLPYVEFQNVYF